MTISEIFENQIPNKLRANTTLAKDIGAVIHFKITGDGGGDWTLDGTKEADWICSGHVGESKMTVICSASDFEKIVNKQMNAQMAAMGGKLKFKPLDMGTAMKLSKIIG